MPRVSRGPHLYLKASASGAQHWYIRDGGDRIATGLGKGDVQGAREALERHIGETTRPQFGAGDPARVPVSTVLALYGRDVAPQQARPHESGQRLARLEEFFGGMPTAEVSPSTCAAYVRWRAKEGIRLRTDPPVRERAVKPQSARRGARRPSSRAHARLAIEAPQGADPGRPAAGRGAAGTVAHPIRGRTARGGVPRLDLHGMVRRAHPRGAVGRHGPPRRPGQPPRRALRADRPAHRHPPRCHPGSRLAPACRRRLGRPQARHPLPPRRGRGRDHEAQAAGATPRWPVGARAALARPGRWPALRRGVGGANGWPRCGAPSTARATMPASGPT